MDSNFDKDNESEHGSVDDDLSDQDQEDEQM